MKKCLRIGYVTVTALAIVVMGSRVAMADDFYPPDWRGAPLTVQVEWDFHTQGYENVPPDYENYVGDGVHQLHGQAALLNATGVSWQEDPSDPGDGMICSDGSQSGQIICNHDNWQPFEQIMVKIESVQISYQGDSAPSVLRASGWIGANEVPGTRAELVEFGQGQALEIWEFEPSPYYEEIMIEIPPGTCLDQVIFDTLVQYNLPQGACCFGDGSCTWMTQDECVAAGGQYMGDGTYCDPNPCLPSPTRAVSWGQIRSYYR